MSESPIPTPEHDRVLQTYGSVTPVRLGLSEEARLQSVSALNRLLAHTIALRDIYKKAHWQISGATFYELHLLFDKHWREQGETMDALAERVKTLGGVALALARDVLQESRIARGPSGVRGAPRPARPAARCSRVHPVGSSTPLA